MSFFVWCLLIYAVASGLRKLHMNQLKERDPDRWARLSAYEDARRSARRRSALKGGFKIARFLMKR